MQLVGTYTSPFARKIRVMLIDKGLSHAFLNESPHEAASRVPAYNPLGKVPALVADSGEIFFDSPVIADYLETLGAAPFFLPADRLEAVRVKQLEALADGVTDAAVLALMESRRPAALQSAAWVERQWGKVHRGLAELQKYAAGRAWLLGDAMSLADIATASMWDWLTFRFPQQGLAAQYPALAAWAAPVLARPAFQATVPRA